jgi:radical SAM protein with 4Fe4S-binding SPASM domain
LENISYIRKQTILGHIVRPRLYYLDLELTERCNNNCIHCCINLHENNQKAIERETSTDQVKEYLSQAADLGCLQVRFTGGEPLLRGDFFELYVFARKLGMKVLIFTNARLISQEHIKLFQDTPPLKEIEISVYGSTKTTYESVSCIRYSYEQFLNGITLLKNANIPFVLKTVLLPQILNEFDEISLLANSVPNNKSPIGCTTFLDLRHRRDNKKKDRQISNLRSSSLENYETLINNHPEYFVLDTYANFATKFCNVPGDTIFRCGAGKNICIDAYGKIQPCLSMRATSLTYPKGTRLVSALDRYGELPEIKANNTEYLEKCAKCMLASLCEQCPAKSFSENGTFDSPIEYFCQITHYQARRLGWIKSDQMGWNVEILKIDNRYQIDKNT